MILARITAALAAAACLCGAALSARRAGAAWLAGQPGAAALERAAQWTPDDGNVQRKLGLATASRPALERAVALNPRDAPAWIELGLLDEAAGRRQNAEHKLLEAVRRSRRYVPRWTLANFYFRSGRPAEFWREARAAAAITYIDPAPLYRLCWRIQPDGAIIRAQVVPEGSRRALSDFVTFLLADGHTEGLRESAEALAAMGDAADSERLLTACERLMESGRWDDARQLWYALGGERAPLTNGTFRTAPGGRGFDWRVLRVPGYSAVQTIQGLRIALDGTQPPDGADLLRQALILPSGTKWRLTVETTEGGPEHSDLYCRVTDTTEREWAATSPLPGQGKTSLDFTGEGPAWLILSERRRSGHTRWNGALVLRRVAIEAQ